MSGVVVLVVLVAAGDARDGAIDAMARVARDALGAGATVAIREFPRLPSDDEALATAEVLHATAVAEVSWADAQHLHARLHAYVEGAPRWVDRQIGFDPVDAPSERGRTLGFAVVSMLPEREAEAPSGVPSKPTVASATLPSPACATPADRAPTACRAVAAIPRSTETSRDVASWPPRVAPPAPDKPPRGALEVAGIGSVGVGGNAGGIGASLGGRWQVTPRFAVRLAGGVRAGEVPVAAASSLVLFGALGLAWESPWRPLPPLAIGLRVDALLLRQQLSHLDSDDPTPVRQAVWMGGADAFIEAFWTVSPNAGVFAGAGTELAFGSATVYIANRAVTEIPVVRLVSEIGAIARF